MKYEKLKVVICCEIKDFGFNLQENCKSLCVVVSKGLILFAVVELPSPHHKWYATNHSVALVDSMIGTVQALVLGFSEIIVEDVRVSGHVQTSALHVVVPTEIILNLLPMINASAPFEFGEPIPSSVPWYVFPGQEYVVLLKAFPARSVANEIFLTEACFVFVIILF